MKQNQFLFRKQFDGVIWGSIISQDGKNMILDVRNMEDRTIRYWKLSLISFDLVELDIPEISWWSNLEILEEVLIISEYQDQSDPNRKKFLKLKDGGLETVEDLPVNAPSAETHPSIYEAGTPYHKTVSEFLSLEIPCSCEYLEIDKKIILSYYLRSNDQLNRYLLMLDDGEKRFKELQDSEMKGFAPGAFFVLDQKLFFVRNRNEICIHSL